MGTKYSSVTITGYNSSPPADDGSTAASNQVTWSKHKTKIGDPLKTAVEAINTALVTALDTSSRSVTANDSTLAGDNGKTIVIASTVTSTITVSLMDAASAAAGYIVTVSNESQTVTHTVGRVTASNTISSVTADYSLPPLSSVTFVVSPVGAGYTVKSASFPVMTRLTNSLSGDVALNNTGSYFDGPSVAQGTSGTWFASGTVTLADGAGVAAFHVKLWDGTTVIASAFANQFSGASTGTPVSLSGFITNPAGNIRISVKDVTSTNGSIIYTNTGNAKDSTISVIRIG